MPLIYDNTSPPTVAKLGENNPLLTLHRDRADHSDVRPLRIGLLNNMPDAALMATERQFLRLIGSESVLQIEPVLMTCQGVERSGEVAEHVGKHYKNIDGVLNRGLDGVILSGANFGNGPIDGLPFWSELTQFLSGSEEHCISILTSCLATHAVMRYKHGIDRVLQNRKVWGVFEHEIKDSVHPLTSGMDNYIQVPHSRWNDISKQSFEASGNQVLIGSEVAGVHLAVSKNFQYVMLQGHPEYDTASLAREFLRDKRLGLDHVPVGYINEQNPSLDLDTTYSNTELEQILGLRNNWRANAKVMMTNWIGLVYKLTHVEHGKKYMDGIDPMDPIGSLKKSTL